MSSDEESEWLPNGRTDQVNPTQTVKFPPSFVRLLGNQVLRDGSRAAQKSGRPEAAQPGMSTILKHLDSEIIVGARSRQTGEQLPQISCHFVVTFPVCLQWIGLSLCLPWPSRSDLLTGCQMMLGESLGSESIQSCTSSATKHSQWSHLYLGLGRLVR